MMKNKFIVCSCPSFKKARIKHICCDKNQKNVLKNDWIVNFAKNKNVFIKTYGCQNNYRDSEIVTSIFIDSGFNIVNNEKDADIIFINTCAVRKRAETKVFGYVSSLKNKIIILSGCMVMEEKIIESIIEKNIQVNIIISMNNIYKIFSLLEKYCKTNKKIIDVNSNFCKINEKLPNFFRNSSFKAFVNINNGCNKLCTYCVVPYTRGPEIERNFEDIVNECKELSFLNYQEVVLLGQNVCNYGLKQNTSFANLLDTIASLNIPRISFLTCHPCDFSLDIIKVMKKHKNILPYIHLPLQSGDDNILRLMGRKYDSKYYLNLINKIKKNIPNVALSTDIIVGFPTETEKEFSNTLKIIKKIKFDNIFVFIFSKREGTPAAKIIDNISEDEKKQRLGRLNDLYINIIEEKNKSYLGKIYDVLVDGVSKKNKKLLEGRLITNRIVHFAGSKKMIGKIIKIKIIEHHPFFLIGKVVK